MAARATDPMTSRMADLTKNEASLERDILRLLEEDKPCAYDALEIAQLIDRAETSVSSAMHILCDEGKAHVAGEHEGIRGKMRQVYAHGPAADWQPGRAMPTRQTGPRNKNLVPDLSFTPFLPSELRPKLAEFNSVEQLAVWLNEEMVKRVELSFA